MLNHSSYPNPSAIPKCNTLDEHLQNHVTCVKSGGRTGFAAAHVCGNILIDGECEKKG